MNCRSSFHGKINEVPGVGVDNFTNTKCRAYFLSHCHSDHTEGLFSNQFLEALSKSCVAIYTSEVTGDIITKTKKCLEKYVKRLKIGTSHIILPSIFDYEEQYVSITVIPAGHCFGSVMFLYETNKHTVLYTGDFRFKESDVPKMGLLHDEYRNPINIDVMYIDTTFLNANYLNFPKRSDCANQVVDIIEKWLKEDDNNAVALNSAAKFGYEFLYNYIYERLKLKVFVNDCRFVFYRNQPGIINSVTNNEEETKIHVCDNCKELSHHDNCVKTNENKNYLSIRLTAMKWTEYDLEMSPIDRVSKNKIYACFPTHCSRSELINFVSYFSPKKVFGFPNEYLVNSPNIEKKASKRKLCS